MDGRWRNVYGQIKRGPKFTRFAIQVELSNGLIATRVVSIGNHELETSRVDCYKWVLNGIVRDLDKQVVAHSR